MCVCVVLLSYKNGGCRYHLHVFGWDSIAVIHQSSLRCLSVDAVNSLRCGTRTHSYQPLHTHIHQQSADKVNQLTALEPLHLRYQPLLALCDLIKGSRLNCFFGQSVLWCRFSNAVLFTWETCRLFSRSSTGETLHWRLWVWFPGSTLTCIFISCTVCYFGLKAWIYILIILSDQDGAEPSANSVSTMNLLRLSHLTDRRDWIQPSQHLLAAFSDRLLKVPIALPDMVRSLMAQHYSLKQVT